jgi:Tol biopolymer transport system component
MTDQSRLQLTDALIEKMLAQRAGPGAPADLVPAIAAAIDSTGQRAPGVLGTLRGPDGSRTRRGPGRTWLLAAGALLLVGGAVAAGSGLVKLPSVVPPVAVIPTPSSAELSASPTLSPAPSATAVVTPAVVVFNKGTGSSAQCGNDGRGGCIPRLWVADLDGTGAHELLPGQSGCQRFQAWSPDGARLLFSRSDCHASFEGMTGTERFYLTDASGSEPQLVDTGCVSPCLSEDDAVFSSDGQRILFVRTLSVPVPASATPDPMGKPLPPMERRVLASIDVATGRVTEVGDFDTCDQCGTQWPRSYPVWSPDRTQIAYTREAIPAPGPQPPSAPALFVADADGRHALQVSPFGQSPGWSPDGARIVFQGIQYSWTGSWFPGKVVRSTSAIYTVRPDGTGVQALTTDGLSYLPAWSRDGRIWFARGGDGTTTSWVMDADGRNAAASSVPPQPYDLVGGGLQPAP